MFSRCQRSNSRHFSAAAMAAVGGLTSYLRIHKRGLHASIWPVLRFRRSAGSRLKEDDEAHTPLVLSWRSGKRGGRGSSIRAQGVACRRKHGWSCSSTHSRPSATTKPSTAGHVCPLIDRGARFAKTMVGASELGRPPRLGWTASWPTRCIDYYSSSFFSLTT